MKPTHIAFIMDGNGRWAIRRGKERSYGHAQGLKRLQEIIEWGAEQQIPYLTFFCFSTENFNRPQKEVDYLMNAFVRFSQKHIPTFIKKGVKVRLIGDRSRLPTKTLKAVNNLEEATKEGKAIEILLAIAYGGHDDIEQAARRSVSQQRPLAECLYTYPAPPVDLMIRTGGEKRISNFLLYQLSYAELVFLDDYWPDFTAAMAERAVTEFISRKRRYGGI